LKYSKAFALSYLCLNSSISASSIFVQLLTATIVYISTSPEYSEIRFNGLDLFVFPTLYIFSSLFINSSVLIRYIYSGLKDAIIVYYLLFFIFFLVIKNI